VFPLFFFSKDCTKKSNGQINLLFLWQFRIGLNNIGYKMSKFKISIENAGLLELVKE